MPRCTTAYECLDCGHSYRRTSPTCNINVDEILRNGLHNIQKAIDDDIITKRITICNSCKKTVTRNIMYDPHLIFDTSILTGFNYINSLDMQPPQYILDDIVKTIIADGHKYYFVGIVSYLKYGSRYDDGHYIAYTYTGSDWYKYDDMVSKGSVATANQAVHSHVMVYIKKRHIKLRPLCNFAE